MPSWSAKARERDALLRDLAVMRDLVTDLLESERLTAGHAALQLQHTDLNALVRQVVAELPAPSAVIFEPGDDLPPLPLDAARVRVVVRNLLDNALRHSDATGQAPQLSTGRDGAQVRLSVRDFGPGVEPGQLPLLGEAFYRPDSARQRSTGGIGLGLYLCRLIAQAHRGSLHFDNAAPGLLVTMRLPIDAHRAHTPST